MRIALDATPLLGLPTGVGRYVDGLVRGLTALPDPPALTLAAFTWRGSHDVPHIPGTSVAGRRAPARALQACWLHSRFPPAEWITGRADVMHGTNFVLPPSRRARGVVTIHDLAYLHEPGTVSRQSLRYRSLVPKALASGAMVVTPSQATADDVAEAYAVPTERLIVTPLGIDPAWSRVQPPDLAWRAAHGLPERYLIAVGSLEPRKNLQQLVRAHEALCEADATTPPLVLAGPAGWGQPLAAGPRVRLIGYRKGDELRRIVAGAELLAFPSLREGFGLPPLEALACGIPVVASDLRVTREVLGEQARFVPPRDPDSLRDALAETLAAGLGDEAAVAARRARAISFTWARCARQTLLAYCRG